MLTAPPPQPRALDLFCGAGGAAAGLMQAGWRVDGVDIMPQPDYPGRFLHCDVAELDPDDLDGYQLVWASPPCQFASRLFNRRNIRASRENLIPLALELIGHSSAPLSVVENIPYAFTLGWLRRDLTLELAHFGPDYGNHRRRCFQTQGFCVPPPALRWPYRPSDVSLTGHGSSYARANRRRPDVLQTPEHRAAILGIDHIVSGGKTIRNWRLAQAVPPAYARYIGEWAIRRWRGNDGPTSCP